MQRNNGVRVTGTMRTVMSAILAEPGAWGLRICERTGLSTRLVYPALDRLEKAGWITGQWETDTAPGWPRRRFYEPAYAPGWYAGRLARSRHRIRRQ